MSIGANRKRGRSFGRRLRGAAASAVDVLMVLVSVAALVSIGGEISGHWRMAVVVSGSMRPSIQPGDAEVLLPELPSAVRVGQIVAIRPPHLNFTVTHRVILVQRHPAGTYIRTKGDANNVADPWGLVKIASPKLWYVGAVLPKIGWLNLLFQNHGRRITVLCALVVIGAGWALYRIWGPRRRPRRSARPAPGVSRAGSAVA